MAPLDVNGPTDTKIPFGWHIWACLMHGVLIKQDPCCPSAFQRDDLTPEVFIK